MEWRVETSLTDYLPALAAMESHVTRMQARSAQEKVWLVEHPPLYTAGSSARPVDLIETAFPVHEIRRGGQYTYHGPGQRVAYLMLDLSDRGRDVRAYVRSLERWLILTLGQFGIEGFVREGRVGVWVSTPQGESKIAALGVRVQKWITSHGVALNVNPDLSHYRGIVPCGIREYGVTSLAALGVAARMEDVDAVLQQTFCEVF